MKTEPMVAAAPIEHIRNVPVCPVEVKSAVPVVPAVPDGAVIEANDAGHNWLSAIVGYARDAFTRESDAKAACEKVAHG
ncbi:hypothetical protein [Asticcacaulis sp. MM231]|uniref:hypothetical protein n=1 Tax=Asticcacaulis sp. MM231 TaxID=3157666 RepID=UPI0032D574CA